MAPNIDPLRPSQPPLRPQSVHPDISIRDPQRVPLPPQTTPRRQTCTGAPVGARSSKLDTRPTRSFALPAAAGQRGGARLFDHARVLGRIGPTRPTGFWEEIDRVEVEVHLAGVDGGGREGRDAGGPVVMLVRVRVALAAA